VKAAVVFLALLLVAAAPQQQQTFYSAHAAPPPVPQHTAEPVYDGYGGYYGPNCINNYYAGKNGHGRAQGHASSTNGRYHGGNQYSYNCGSSGHRPQPHPSSRPHPQPLPTHHG
jgi:hypothetical protein